MQEGNCVSVAVFEEEDEDGDYDDDDMEDPFFDELGDIQAEEPTERPTVAPKPMSSFTEYKWKHFGSPTGVAESRRNHLNPGTDSEYGGKVKAVLEHNQRVNQQGRCRSPSPKVIPVQKEHPDPTKTYTPHCTVLHRCGEDTGCCKYDNICQYKKRVLVQLYFYSTTLDSTRTKVEKLSFYNHTECECREKTNETSTEQPEDNSSVLSFKSADTYSSAEVLQCKCPKHFKLTPVDQYNSCHCDCEEENVDCIQLKMGNEHFSMTDRICILNNDCTIPACEYGTYSRKEGKCPSIKQKMMDYKGIRINY
ncbi:uncharacterized protein LOC108917336 [Anoplophora glabripennis]|uniref:uncharacterized protein LOC108917336 n=1 Tax=Anoplophora glabripennis TaxID=217634 RepID=UPI000873E2AE|nr:uncharacterized protein LOC108917336 [Anoplophora glabripennis]